MDDRSYKLIIVDSVMNLFRKLFLFFAADRQAKTTLDAESSASGSRYADSSLD